MEKRGEARINQPKQHYAWEERQKDAIAAAKWERIEDVLDKIPGPFLVVLAYVGVVGLLLHLVAAKLATSS